MKYFKKSKYRFDLKSMKPKKEEDITLEDLYKEQLKNKVRRKK